MSAILPNTTGRGPYEAPKPEAPRKLYAEVPIDSGADEIRLLQVRPGQVDDGIQCDLVVASLSKRPRYSALSYVWANYTVNGELDLTQDRYNITIRGYNFPVGRNLYRALRRLRSLYKSRQSSLVLWVDAICIDQSDLLQRNHQVSMMGAVYSGCQECHIWMQNMTGRTHWRDTCQETWEFTGDERDFGNNWEAMMDSCTLTSSDRTPNSIRSVSIKSIRLSADVENYSLHIAWFFRLLATDVTLDEILSFHDKFWEQPEILREYFHTIKELLLEICEDTWHSRLSMGGPGGHPASESHGAFLLGFDSHRCILSSCSPVLKTHSTSLLLH